MVKNSWSPEDRDDKWTRLILDTNGIFVLVAEDQIWLSEFDMVLQEQIILE